MKNLLRIVIAIAVAIVLNIIGVITTPYWTHGSKDVTVTSVTIKRVIDHGQAKDIYLVFTDDQTYKNVDSPAYLKFNSSDVQGRLSQGGRFHIEYYGFRIAVASQYKNIIKAKKLP